MCEREKQWKIKGSAVKHLWLSTSIPLCSNLMPNMVTLLQLTSFYVTHTQVQVKVDYTYTSVYWLKETCMCASTHNHKQTSFLLSDYCMLPPTKSFHTRMVSPCLAPRRLCERGLHKYCMCVSMMCVADSNCLSGCLCFSHGVIPVDESEEESFLWDCWLESSYECLEQMD